MYEAGRGFLSSLLPFTSSSPSLTSIPPLPQFPSAPPRQQRKPTELRQLLRALSLTHDRSDSEDSEEEDDDSEEEGGEDVNEEEVDSEVDEARVDESEEEEEMMRADADEDELLSLVRSRIEKKKNGAKLLEAFDEKWREMQEVERKQGWSRERTRLHEHRFVPGAPRLLPNCTTPVDFFHQLLPVAFIDAMVERTNTYAVARHLRRKENVGSTVAVNAVEAAPQLDEEKNQPQPTERKEMLAFIGCVLCMGINVLRDTKRYWSADLGTPLIKDTFSRNRFLHLLRCLHIEDVEAEHDPQDRLHKIRELHDLIRTRSQAAYYPAQHLTIDEAMVGFQGRHKMKQYVMRKTVPTGFKIWTLVECSTGYVYNFDVYQGKVDRKTTETGQTQAVVNTLLTAVDEQRWHIIGMDGFFSSVPLFKDLYRRGFHAVATTRQNRELFPRTLLTLNAELKEGQYIYRQCGNIVCVSWKDQKPVNLLSTYCDPMVTTAVSRWRKSTKGGRRDKAVDVQCPEVVVEYHRWMRGVDVFSQRESYARPGRKSRRWWPRLAWFLIDMAVSNAYVLYRQYAAGLSPQPAAAKSPTEFRRALINALVGTFTSRKKRGRPWHPVKLSADEPQHIPQLHREKAQPCVVCARNVRVGAGGNKPRTREGCRTCRVAVHINCWKEHLPHDEREDEMEN
jgi:hypothetical protein